MGILPSDPLAPVLDELAKLYQPNCGSNLALS